MQLDIRLALRLLRKNPGFTAAALLSLGLGIGVNTTVFTLINAVFLAPVPVEDPDGLVGIYSRVPQARGGARLTSLSLADYRDLQGLGEHFSGVAAFRWTPLSLAFRDSSERVSAHLASANYFEVLGVQPFLGRTFLHDEDRTPGAHPLVVLGHDLWQRRFEGDRGIVGRTVTINRQSFTVVGVAPPGFRGPLKLGPVQIWTPLSNYQALSPPDPPVEARGSHLFQVMARLRPGMSIEAATTAVSALSQRIAEDYPDEKEEGWSATLLPFSRATIGPGREDILRRSRLLLMGAATLVLLIAVSNVANMLLARGIDRSGEMAIRLSLGAHRGHLLRQLVTEGLLLSLFSGVLGFLIAFWGHRLLWSLGPSWLQESELQLQVDYRVLVFTLVLSMLTGVLFGLTPAWRSSMPDLTSALRERSASSTGSARLLRNALAASQICLCFIALVGTSLFLKSLYDAYRINPGFDVEPLLFASVDLGAEGYDDARARDFQARLLERLRAAPGVQSAAMSEFRILFFAGLLQTVLPEGQEPPPEGEGLLVRTNGVDPEYFRTLGIPILRGRGFNNSDREGAPLAAIVNQNLADLYWSGKDPVGRRFRFEPGGPLLEIVGVAEDSDYVQLGEDPIPFIYLSRAQHPVSTAQVYVRAQGDPARLVPVVRREIQALDPTLPILEVRTASELVDSALWARRFAAIMIGIFGVLALILASLGVYSVMSYSVRRRYKEFAVRLALGARPATLRTLVFREAILVAGAGVVLGTVGVVWLSRFLSGFLEGGEALSALPMIAVSSVVTAVVLLASFSPARSAARTPPALVLRQE